ncbi:MAG: NUDIX hydrolase [Clostridia bacterium]|nr:NUDIX hydrolase [Clostridia bacterium]
MNKLIKKEIKYSGRRFKVIQKLYERQDGLEIVRDCVEPGDAVIIIAVNENEEIIFIEQYRETIEKVALELPAGMVDFGEDPKDAAKRELEEETGIKATNIEYLTSCFTSAGYTSEKIHVYLARDFEYGIQHLDETEEILAIRKIHIEDCMKMILEDKIEHASVYIAVQTYYYKYYNGGRNG